MWAAGAEGRQVRADGRIGMTVSLSRACPCRLGGRVRTIADPASSGQIARHRNSLSWKTRISPRFPGVVADDDRLADKPGQRDVHVAQALEADAVAMHDPGLGHGEEQEVQILQALGHLREERPGFPPLLGWVA